MPARPGGRRPVRALTRRTQIRCEPDPREHPFHRHHEKTVVIDGELAFVGGIDMTDSAGDRFDTSAHEARRCLAGAQARRRPIGCWSCPVCRDARAGCWDRWRG
jgi:hypothetical protein